MSKRFEVKSWRKSHTGKAYTVRIGSAWTDDKGLIRLSFDALPIADDQNRVQCFLEEPREREETPRKSPGRADVSDDIPF